MNRENRESEIRELKQQVTLIQQKANAKTDTIVRLGQDLQISENEKKELEARVKTFERNLERSERELELVSASESSLKIQYAKDRQDMLEDIDRLKRENEVLKLQNKELLDEKIELRKDCKTFRQTIAKYEVERLENTIQTNKSESSATRKPGIEIHEKLHTEYKQMESDLHTLLGIKEELLIERDQLQRKVERLSNELSFMLTGDSRRVAEDMDSLLAENRFLKARLNTAQEESDTIKSTLAKYKTMVESVHSHPSPKCGEKEVDLEGKANVAVINMKQIRELLASHSIELDESDYRAITTILLDLCNDKQMALAHLRRTNKVLGTRLHDVELKLSQLEAKSRSSSPRHDESSSSLSVPETPNK